MEQNPTIPPLNPQETIDFNKLLIILRNNWVWIALVVLVVNMTAYLFIRYTKNMYESESELKLDIKTDATELGIKASIEDQNVNLVSGEIEIIRSKLFLNRVLDSADLEVSLYSVGRVLDDELFFSGPATIQTLNKRHGMHNIPIRFEEIDLTSFMLRPADDEEITGRYGEPVLVGDLSLMVRRNADYQRGQEVGYFFTVNSRDALLDYLSANLTAEPLNFNANTIRLSFKDHNPFKAQYVLSKIDTLYLQYSNDQKNLANKQKIDWLANELGHIEKRMEDYETYFENFTLENKTNDLDLDLRETIRALNSVDSQRFEMTRRIDDVSKLVEAMNSHALLFSLSLRRSLPTVVTNNLEELQHLQQAIDRLKLSYQEVTFAYRQKEEEIEALRSKTLTQLNDIKSEWQKKLSELNRRKTILENDFAALPDKNTQFTKNQRFYKLYEEFYLTLMQSKSEFEIAQAGSTPDFKILSPATLTLIPISPHKLMVAGVGVVASILLSFFLTTILYLANNKINGLYELDKLATAPLLGTVPLSRQLNGGFHILEHPRSMVSESIRTLRTNLDFFNVHANKKVIAISSTVSGEGKSFIAMNLGGVVALSNKKVVLIDLDMRKAKADHALADPDPSRGISTILIRRNTWLECVVKTPVENLHFIPSGPHPPNPSELLLNGEFTELIDDLRKHYDYILLDTPPVGLVTDGIMAMKKADISIYVFRANYSKREFLQNLKRIININRFSNITTLLNAVPASGKTYGYGYYEESRTPRKLKSYFNT